MEFSNIRPFVRYVHYLPLDPWTDCPEAIPYDNRIFFTYYGSGEIWVGEKKYKMNKGSLIIVPSGIGYRIVTAEERVTYIAVNFDYTFENADKQNPIPPTSALGYDPKMRVEQVHFEDIECFNREVYMENMFKFDNEFLKIYKEFSGKIIFSDGIISNLLGEILLTCGREVQTKAMEGSAEIINQITDYIRENYGKKITNKAIGERFSMHPNYISKLFKDWTGMPLHQYILQIRISSAAEMLASKKYSVSEISEKCGFSDVHHFSKAFKRITGAAPSKYT